MRFMMLMIPNVYQGAKGKNLGPEFAPGADDFAKMGKYNKELADSGALLALDGLQPMANGARVSFRGGKPKVTDGPYTESKEVLGGYWMIQVKSKDEALEWARRVPAQDGDVIEVRQVFEVEDLPPDVVKAAGGLTVRAQIEKMKS